MVNLLQPPRLGLDAKSFVRLGGIMIGPDNYERANAILPASVVGCSAAVVGGEDDLENLGADRNTALQQEMYQGDPDDAEDETA
jgi:hypothetical protein